MVDRIFTQQASGTGTDLPQLDALKAYVRESNTRGRIPMVFGKTPPFSIVIELW